jgi:putative DNA methylase
MAGDYIKAEGKDGRLGARLMAIVAEGERGRVYLAPTPEMEAIALTAQPTWKPETPLPDDPRNFWTVQYGLTTYGHLFTPRQLVALTTFSDLVQEARERVKADGGGGPSGQISITFARPSAQFPCQILGFQVGVTLEHGHCLMPGDAGHFHHAEIASLK